MKGWLTRLIYPLGVAVALLGFGAVAVVCRWTRWARVLVLVALTWLWVWSMPVFSDWLRGSLESHSGDRPLERVEPVDAIVVLGGAFTHYRTWRMPNLNAAADRYWAASRLYRAGKADWIIVTGGRRPQPLGGLTEAAAAVMFLEDLGVPGSAILRDDKALTTRDNALHVAAMAQRNEFERVLLVTSALHMRRAEAAFFAVGLEVEAFAADFEVASGKNGGLLRWLPSASALADSTRAWHEYLGFWLYRWRGWA